MKLVEGLYNQAVVYTDVVEDTALAQIRMLCDQEFVKGARIRIMPDVHTGAGCTIGTTMTIKDAVVPNLVGVDIGCGMEIIRIKGRRLGGGNHFIEVDKDEEGALYVVIHSGSRHLGLEVAEYYQEQAYQALNGVSKKDIKKLIETYKKEGREQEIQTTVEAMKARINTGIPKTLAYCQGELMEDYIHDMKIIQRFAMLNRKAMMDELIRGMKLKVEEEFTTIHNYIDTEAMILRKGAVSAKKGERLLIPVNMRDGSLICVGKGNEEWNFSAPHGAGRLMSRRKAKESYTVSQFKKEMAGIFTTSVNALTLDECPMAYKRMEDIVENIGDTVEIEKVLRPVYNFKAGEKA